MKGLSVEQRREHAELTALVERGVLGPIDLGMAQERLNRLGEISRIHSVDIDDEYVDEDGEW